jgi:photosystem II stability/assembly factor-like uncharacterized protein
MNTRIAVAALMCAVALHAQSVRRAGGPKPAPAEKPKVQYRWDVQKSGVEDNLNGVCFVDRQTGYAVGNAGTIVKTTDGGNTWTRLMERRADAEFRSVVFVSPAEGWVEARALLHTSDGGESWQPAVPLPGPDGFGGGSVLGGSRIQMHVPGMGVGVFRSDDGGRAWRSLGDPGRNDFTAVFFVDAQLGWVSGDHGRLASTTDGGATWVERELPLKADLTKIQFVSPQVGWILPHRGHQGGPLATVDGGATWTSQYAGLEPHRPLMDMQFLNAQTGFLLAEANRGTAVLTTSNGGKSWRTIGNVENYSDALSFPAVDEGWVVGPKGYIVHYHKVVLEQ